MTNEKHCRECGVQLVVGKNITQNMIDRLDYWCRECKREYNRSWREANPDKAKAMWTRRHRKCGQMPMSENKSCSLYLGVCVAERLLPHVFDNVVRMPINNPGYDFVCNKGFKVDVKGACRMHRAKRADHWMFAIKRNKEAHYFLLIAFDDREGLNPEHVWLIPAEDINHLEVASISVNTLDKWKKYELTDKLDKVISCCDTMKNNAKNGE